MARQMRILFPGAWYHVMNRGANRQDIFLKAKHRREFVSILEQITAVYNIELHAYCLMSNHYHLLIRTPDANLSEAMKYLDSVYTARFNKDLGRDGPLLRGRYKSLLIEADVYLTHVSRYIHLNPLEAGMVNDLADYRWSSYRAYIGIEHKAAWLHTNFIYKYFSGDDVKKQYFKYVTAGNSKEIIDFYSSKRLKPFLASKSFIKKLNISSCSSDELTNLNKHLRLSLVEILSVVSIVTGVNESQIRKLQRGKINIPRALFIFLCRKISGYKLIEIALFLGNTHYTTISTVLKHFESKLIKQPDVKSFVAVSILKMEEALLQSTSQI